MSAADCLRVYCEEVRYPVDLIRDGRSYSRRRLSDPPALRRALRGLRRRRARGEVCVQILRVHRVVVG